MNRDALAAHRYFEAAVGSHQRLCVLGHSMGNGPMLEDLPAFMPAAVCVVAARPLSSLRDWGAAYVSRLIVYMIPDAWNSVPNVAPNGAPLLLVHSRSDTVNPVEMRRRVVAAARERKRMIELAGFKHNAPYKTPSIMWWSSVLTFVHEGWSSG